MRAAVYVRISKDRPGQGLGVARQEKACKERAEGLGWQVVGTYTDNDLSAASGKPRPAYQRLLEAIEAGDVQAVVVWSLDRLHRRPVELEHFMALVDRHRVELASCGGDVDLATPGGRLHARTMGNVAAHEVEQLKARLKLKFDELRANGHPTSGVAAFGYAHVPNGTPRRIPVPAEAETVRRMAGWVLEGVSLGEVARRLDADGVLPRGGGAWNRTTLRALLKSPTMCGDLVHKGEVIARDVFEPILDRATWWRLQSVLTAPGRRQAAHTNSRRHLLSGIAVCGECGSGLQVHFKCQRGKTYLGYRCPPTAGTHVRVSMPQLDGHVIRQVQAYAADHAWKVSGWETDAGQQALVDEIEALEQQMVAAGKEFAGNGTSPAFAAAYAAQLQGKIDEAKAKLTVPNPVTGLGDWVRFELDGLPSMPLAEQRSAVKLYTTRIAVGPATRRGREFDPDRVRIDWRDTEAGSFRAVVEA